MSVIDTLVTDRTQADVDAWQALHDKGAAGMTAAELSVWLSGMKGSYNPAVDLNRVAVAMGYLAERFRSHGYAVTVSSRSNWTVTDTPRLADMEVYLSDLRRLRSALSALRGTPEVPSDMSMLTWQEANDIERILVDLDLMLDWVVRSFLPSGAYEFQSGHTPIYTEEVDPGRTWAELDAMNLDWDDWNGTTWFGLLYGEFGRTWAELDALGLSWEQWDRMTWFDLLYKEMST